MRARNVLWCIAFALGCDRPAATHDVESAKVVESTPADTIDEDVKLVSAGPLVKEPIVILFAVYAMPGARADVEAVAVELREKTYAQYKTVDAFSDDMPRPGIQIGSPPIAEYSPPDLEMLAELGRGLSEAQMADVQKSPKLVTLALVGDASSATQVHGDAIAMAGEVAERTGGLVFDVQTHQLFSREAWKERENADVVDSKNLPKHFTIHLYRDDALMRMVTLGLEKFGLPNLVVESVSSHDSEAMGGLVNAAAIAMHEAGTLAREGVLELRGSSGPVELRLAVAKHEEGDPDGRLVEVVFPGPRASLHERQAATLEALAETQDDPVVIVDPDHPEMLAASAAAKREVLLLKPRFAKGVPEHEHLMVKAPFDAPNGDRELMWVEVVRWNGGTIEGILQNKPSQIPELKIGAKVEVAADSIRDYVHEKADGTIEGRKTESVLRQLEAKRERREEGP